MEAEEGCQQAWGQVTLRLRLGPGKPQASPTGQNEAQAARCSRPPPSWGQGPPKGPPPVTWVQVCRRPQEPGAGGHGVSVLGHR